ncbi:hypothetical protein P8X37_01405 [Pyrococcus kukulkanii]|uniref:Uncharacterized protein n=1 Tax=Pyrococcus kukulkanii TaxID=1609559 RepID=A0ABV4T3Y4_9EURY
MLSKEEYKEIISSSMETGGKGKP